MFTDNVIPSWRGDELSDWQKENRAEKLKEVEDWEVIEYKIEDDSFVTVNRYPVLEFYPTMFERKH